MIDFWIFPLSTIWGAYQNQGFPAFSNNARKEAEQANGRSSLMLLLQFTYEDEADTYT